jgi:hypothetical protein
MSLIQFKKVGIYLIVGFLVFIVPQFSFAKVTPDDGRMVSVRALEIGKVVGANVDSLSLMAMKDGKLVAIPSQIDEMTEEGYVYFEEGKYKNSGEDGVFDQQDLLMFMLKDSGDKLGGEKIRDGKLLAEIETTFMSGKKGYVYLIEDALIKSDEVYVRYSVETGRVETDYYFLKSKPDNAFVWEELYVESFDGKNKHYPFDTMKLRFGSSVAFVGPRLNFSNNNIVAKPVADKTGAIRSIAQYKLQVKIAGIPFLSFDLQTFMSEQGLRYIALMKIPVLRRTLISRPSVFISLDGRELDGAKALYAGHLNEPLIVDGNISDTEQFLMDKEINQDENWIMLSTGNNLDGLAILNFSEFGKYPVSPFIQDGLDIENKPEFHKGQSPNVGFQIKGMAFRGVQVIDVTLHLFDDEVTSDLTKFVKQFKADTHVSVKYY